MAVLNNIQALTHALDLAMEKHQNVIVYGEDAGYEGGVFRATVGLQQKYGEERCFDAPIAEATLVGTAVGMAINGLKPVVEIQFEGFSYPIIQQLFTHVARMRNRSRGRFSCPMVIRMPMGGGIRALEHHSEAMEAMFAHNPGLKVVIPSTPFDTKGLLLAAVESPDPVLFLEPTKIYRAFKQDIPDEYYTLPIGEGYKVQEGTDVTIVTYGAQVGDCEKAIEQLKGEGKNVSVDLIDLRTIQPWDREMVIESVKKTGRLIVVHEAVRSFSVAAEVIATVNEKCFEYLKAPCARVTGYDIIVPFDRGEHFHQPSVQKIVVKIKEVLDYQF
ncbi:pyruvate dehydrogenase E1 component subunit beta [Spiroplasma syrphidicola EA-1]|uniref:Pyruvate dehydrogenase E1 component subunit beta n=1 Tax=Spiroplasma syrphidicola EA-1 TaxID=1276229 RepID=R4UD98_9MOLU|nr:alpha-ketoacid dehydrogenase subunit beta [Spiroplasma syrphidicola]AGM25889.1 pyruvate dehydrogenase E1 component subunit beta [Spiroplasma syrphidicola EA-1]